MLAAGDQADIVILPLESFAAFERDGVTDAASRRDLGAVGIGVAVRSGAALPDLSSEDGLRSALLAAKSITFMDPERGTSGKYFDEVVLPRLAIRDEVRAKTILGEGGMIAEKVARGEVEIAFQQMTELLPVAGIRIAGGLPPSLQKTTVYSGAVLKKALSPADAASLLMFLSTGEGRQAFLDRGFTAP
jgi:molybdate transport system substrate-binding protein